MSEPRRPLPARRGTALTPSPPTGGPAAKRAGAPDTGELTEILRGAAGVAEVVAESSWKLAGWTARVSMAGAKYVVRRAAAGESATSIMQAAASDLRDVAWRALGPAAAPDSGPTAERDTRASRPLTSNDLRRRGAELLRMSNDVHFTEDTHPAFARILGEITPDEARILRFLYVEGPQPAVDIRTSRPLTIGSQLVASGLNMIGEQAGCRRLDLVTQYLANLERLGLIDFASEPVSNPQRYQLVEAQPQVTAVMRRAGRMPRTVHRSITLTEFGRTFCETCLPIGDLRVAPRPDLH